MSAPYAINAQIDTRYSFLPHLKGQTHYHRAGPDNGPVVVMVSGATLPMAVWASVVTPLVGYGFHIVRYDLPGRGHTPLKGLGADFQSHIDQLHHLLAGLGIHQPVHLVGLASGALIVAAYAERYRARVARACLIAPDGASTRFTLAERLLTMPLLGALLFRYSARRTLLARVPRYSARPDIQTFVRNLLDFALRCPGFHAAILATVKSFPLHHGEAQYRRLAQSGVPTCVVWGREDRITPPDTLGAMGALFGAESLHVLENVGHLPFVEDPTCVATILERHFLKL